MEQRTKGIVLQCSVFVFFVVLAANGMYENSVLNKRLLQLRDYTVETMAATAEFTSQVNINFELARRVTKANAESVSGLANFAKVTRDKLEQETVLALPGVIAASMKSVVHIEYPSGHYMGGNSSGTGWVLNAEKGYIVTAAHVASGFEFNPEVATVELMGERKVRIDKVWVDPNDDMAIIALDVNDPNYIDIMALKLAEHYKIHRGDLLLTLGGPYGRKFSAGFGIVSNPLIFEDVCYPTGTEGYRIQFDATQNPGNSGGALVNIRGNVIGMGVSGFRGGGGVNFGVTLGGIRASLERFEVWLGARPGIVEAIH